MPPASNDPTLPTGYSRETTIRRDAAGRWFHDGELVENENVARAFDSWVDLADDGRTCLRNAIHWVYVAIEGPPYFVRTARREGQGFVLELSGGACERLDPASLRLEGDVLYCRVRDGKLDARFDRHAMFALEPWLGEDATGVYLEAEGARHHPRPIHKTPSAG